MPCRLTGHWIYVSLTFWLYGREWRVSYPGCFTSGDRAPEAHWIAGWVDPEPIWTVYMRENSLAPILSRASCPKPGYYTDWVKSILKYTRMEVIPRRHRNWLDRSPVLLSTCECGSMRNWSMFLSLSTAVYMMLRFVLFFAILGYSLSTTGKLVAWLPSDIYL
jgi:hypothetical protein